MVSISRPADRDRQQPGEFYFGTNEESSSGIDTLKPPDNITLLCLPPYSPELNPVENVWEYLRKNKLALRVHDSYEAIVEACCSAWADLIAIPARLASITVRDWAKVS